MIQRTVLAAVAALLIATPAFAFHCPKDAKAIDHGLAVLKVDDAMKSKVKTLRDKGMEQHKAGKHADSVKTLAEAMRVLLTSVK